MVEFALVLPVLLLIIVGIVKLGIVFNNYITLNDAVRAGARQLAIGRGTADACTPAVNRVKSSASNLDQSQLTVDAPTVTSSCSSLVLGTDATIHATYPCDVKIPPFIDISLTCSASTTERVE
jgi:Flp pilus assembly protein TadG